VQSDHHKCLESDGHELFKVFRSVYMKSFWQTTKPQSGYLVTEPKLD